MTAGVCRFCGCTEFDPCPGGCAWTTRAQTVCTTCTPAEKAERRALDILRAAGYRTARPGLIDVAFVEAFHRGFVVGWFQVTPRSAYSRNPYRGAQILRHVAWNRGQHAGAEAGRLYRAACGPLENTVRRDVLRVSRRPDRRQGRRVARPGAVR